MTIAKSQKRTRPTMRPDTGPPLAVEVSVLLAAALLGLPAAAAWETGDVMGTACFGIPAVVLLGPWLWGRALLVVALFAWRSRGIRGVLVYSESPIWQPYVEAEWLPKIEGRVLVLNWSQRAKWRKTLGMLVWRHFCGGYRNLNPAVVALRGLRHPRVFRFYGACQNAKHGDDEGLRGLEAQMLVSLGIRS